VTVHECIDEIDQEARMLVLMLEQNIPVNGLDPLRIVDLVSQLRRIVGEPKPVAAERSAA
jgi:hypothetical protein